MAEELYYIATGDHVAVHIYPLDQMVTVSQWVYSSNAECVASGECDNYYFY